LTQSSLGTLPAAAQGMSKRLLWVRRLGFTCVALTFLLMTVGAWVKANGAGLACPDWPACYGEWLPPFPSRENGGTWTHEVDGVMVTESVPYSQAQVLYEWTHRAIVALIGIPVLAFAAVAWRGRELRPSLRWLPLVAVAVLALQALLGRLTVVTGNPPWATTMHLSVAVLWFAILLTATCIAYLAPRASATPVAPRTSAPHPAFTPNPASVRFVYPGEDTARPSDRSGEGPHGG